MISINTDMYLLCSMFNVSQKKISEQYSGMSIEQIMQAEAAQGNSAAASFDQSILNDPAKLIELFQLKDPSNKYAILSNMNEHDLQELLPLLETSDLVMGLNFFDKDKLLSLDEQLPKDQLINLTFQMFSPDQIMQLMPEDQLNQLLTSPDLDKGLVLKYLPSLKPEVLAQMLEGATGQAVQGNTNSMDPNAGLNSQVLAAQISSLPDDKFKEAMISMPTQNKRDFILQLTQENPKLFQLFDASAYTNIINQHKDKADIIKASSVIEKDQLVKMLKELPQNLTAVVVTQIDTKKFADVLIANFKDILKQVVAS